MKNPQTIVITGASSGLGEALAYRYAIAGHTLHLHGRNRERLERVAKQCERQGAMVCIEIGDVTDREAMARWLLATDTATPIDLLIANAGISAGTGVQGESPKQAKRIFATNIDGVLNTIDPVIARMVERGNGQIALISSLAGIRGLPSSPAYSASKAWVRVYGEALRGWLCHRGVEISVVCPGYIKTPMTDVNNFPMPFIMNAAKAAHIIAGGLARNRARIAFPRLLYWPLWWLSCLPTAWSDLIFSRLPAKPSL
ncbi:MAG: SDR family NAD(P)-dependent oxidoreductase [Rickettsiales bacterium]|nr:SDR family NAD(P)-dependent oxidoreductase [Rickettsiales bacterium]